MTKRTKKEHDIEKSLTDLFKCQFDRKYNGGNDDRGMVEITNR